MGLPINAVSWFVQRPAMYHVCGVWRLVWTTRNNTSAVW